MNMYNQSSVDFIFCEYAHPLSDYYNPSMERRQNGPSHQKRSPPLRGKGVLDSVNAPATSVLNCSPLNYDKGFGIRLWFHHH